MARDAQAVVQIQQLLDVGQQFAPGGIQDGQPAAAVEQFAPQLGLQRAHLEAHRRLGQGDLLGGFGERAMVGDGQESPHKAQGAHGVLDKQKNF